MASLKRVTLMPVIALLLYLLIPLGSVNAQENSPIEQLPGAEAFAQSLQNQIAVKLRAKAPSYQARSQHLRSDGTPLYTNRLLLEASPYLQQHAHNPVNWFPWGEEAFQLARQLNRPVLLSIGYSTCHWCHVMEEESYDNPEIAKYLNQHFIAIKVDRESRPDIDSIYMQAVQTMTGHGGWPLNVFLLPNKQAFFGGTYFPPQDSRGRKGLMTVLKTVRDVFNHEQEKIKVYAGQLTEAIRGNLDHSDIKNQTELDSNVIAFSVKYVKQHIDAFSGGLGGNMKFPSSTPLRLMMRKYQQSPAPDLKQAITLTLDKMAAGGIYDQLGGGFHRYATDSQWRVPHFEKMLYDNALLAMVYLEAYQLFHDQSYKRVVIETLDYIAREMTAPEGGFYSATDADSLNDQAEAEEGWYFTWLPEELETLMPGNQAGIIADWFGIDKVGELDGRNILYRPYQRSELVTKHHLQDAAFTTMLNQARQSMLSHRALRIAPLRDDKIITAWNGLMIATFAKAGLVLNRQDYLGQAQQAVGLILSRLFNGRELSRVYLKGQVQGPAFLNDYAFLIYALLELYQADANPGWLKQAKKLQKIQDALYLDLASGVYYQTAYLGEELLYRNKPIQDGVLPSGNSMSVFNLLRLSKLTTNSKYQQQALTLLNAVKQHLDKNPLAMTDMLIALDFALQENKEIVLVLGQPQEHNQAMLNILRETYIPEHVTIIVDAQAILPEKENISPLLDAKRVMNGKATAFVCKNKVCKLPVTDPSAFAKQLQPDQHAPTL